MNDFRRRTTAGTTKRLALSTTHVRVESRNESASSDFGRAFWIRFRVIVLAGFLVGIPVIGLGSRLAMLLLRLTSPDAVIGATSDDGFTIGKFTVGGTYNLMMMGVSLGVLGAAVYLVIKPLLFGPSWFRRLATGIGSGLVVASIVIRADGADFAILTPTWLAIGLFVSLPVLFGTVIGPVVDSIAARDRATTTDRAWVLPLAVLAPFPLSWIIALPVAGVLTLWLRHQGSSTAQTAMTPAMRLAGQVVIVTVAFAGLLALLNDIDAII